MTLSSPLPAAYQNPQHPLFLRIWQGQQAIDLASQPITLFDPTTSTSPGIQVTITVPSGGPSGAALPHGAYWMIAVRPSTPQAVYPERFLTAAQWSDGPHQWLCPLAIIEWASYGEASFASASGPADNVIDCRQCFGNLVALSNRLGACCAVTVTPADAPNLQSIIDQAAASGATKTVCFKPGIYSLLQPLRLRAQHSGLTFEGCGGAVSLQASTNAELGAFLDGLLVLVLADGVSLKNLLILAPAVPLAPALAALGNYPSYSGTSPTHPAALAACRGCSCLPMCAARDRRVLDRAIARGQFPDDRLWPLPFGGLFRFIDFAVWVRVDGASHVCRRARRR